MPVLINLLIMYKKRFLTLGVCALSGTILVVVLFALSSWIMRRGGGFIRKQPSHLIVGTGFFKLTFPKPYFAGADSDQVFVTSWISRGRLYGLALKDRTIDSILVKVPDTLRFSDAANVGIVSGQYLIGDGLKKQIAVGDLKDGNFAEILHSPFFTSWVAVNKEQVIVRTFNNKRDNILLQLTSGEPKREFVLEHPGDAIFSADGQLLITPDRSKIIYTYHYFNRFEVLDANLELLYSGKTIDTIAHPHIKTVEDKEHQLVTMAETPPFVNEQCAVDNQYLYVHSVIKADNESENVFDHATAIDVYSLNNGTYQFTLYVPDLEGMKMQDFTVANHHLVGLFDGYAYKFKLNFK